MDGVLPYLYQLFWIVVLVGIWYAAKKYFDWKDAQKAGNVAPYRPPPAARPPVAQQRAPLPPQGAAPAPLAVPAALLALPAWLRRANHEPDRSPHLAVTGPSGSGKSTLILALLADRPGRVLICTPKARRADPWGGLPVVRLRVEDMSFAPIGDAIGAVYAEMLRRNAEDADVADDWLTLVVDEYSTVIGKLPDLREKVLDMVTLGRSARIRVIIGATETNVKAWGWEGRGEARGNVLFVECEEETYRAWAFRWGKEKAEIDTRGVPMLAGRGVPMTRWWTPPNARPVSPPARAKWYGLDDPDQTGLAGLPHQDAETTPDHLMPQTAPQTAPQTGKLDPEIIRALFAAGWSKNKICTKMTGGKDKKLDLIDAALAEVEVGQRKESVSA